MEGKALGKYRLGKTESRWDDTTNRQVVRKESGRNWLSIVSSGGLWY